MKSSMGRGARRIAQLALQASPYGADYMMAKEAARGVKRGRGLYVGEGLYTGAGRYDYVPASNDLVTSGVPSSKSDMDIVPKFAVESDDGVIVSRREYVSEIYAPASSSSFQIQNFPINPGLELTFPWLSQIACNYDEYELIQCIFTFKSTTSESSSSTNGQVGTVIMATNYNAAAANFTDKVTMMQYAFANSGRLTDSLIHGVECDPSKLSGSPGNYIRNNPVVTGQDLKTYDHGKFQIAVANIASAYANSSIGELWVSYTVRLRKPKFYSAIGLSISKDIFCSNGGETTGNQLGSNLCRGQQNNIGVAVTNINPTSNVSLITLTFPAAYKGNVRVSIAVARPTVIATGAGSTFSSFNWFDYGANPGYPGTNRGYLVSVSGNVVPIADLYGGGGVNDTQVDAPVPCITGGEGGGSSNQLIVCHLAVNIATGNTNNTATFQASSVITGADQLNQTYLEIAEYNAGFSYAATGLGVSNAPVWVNSSGTVVVI